MALIKYTLGQLLDRNKETNEDLTYGPDDVRGVLNSKAISSNTKADVSNRDLSKFLVVRPGGFVFNHRVHDKLGLGYNTSTDTYIFTNDYVAFYIKPELNGTVILPDYLYMWYLREEFDRYMLFKTYGSATLFFNWDDMCELEIELPDIEIQQKYVNIYNAMLTNQQNYERGLEDLKLVCDGYIEDLRRRIGTEPIKPYISPCDERNTNLEITNAQGITNEKIFAAPKQVAASERSAKIVRKGQFAYNRATTRNGEKISIAYRDGEDCVVSSAYQVFTISSKDKLLPEYLMMWFKRAEFDRYARYMSKGSAHEFFEYSDMEEVAIPIPSIAVQRSISNVYNCYVKRKDINNKLKAQIKDICAILIKGSIDEARKEA